VHLQVVVVARSSQVLVLGSEVAVVVALLVDRVLLLDLEVLVPAVFLAVAVVAVLVLADKLALWLSDFNT
jgi:hypothetical protein